MLVIPVDPATAGEEPESNTNIFYWIPCPTRGGQASSKTKLTKWFSSNEMYRENLLSLPIHRSNFPLFLQPATNSIEFATNLVDKPYTDVLYLREKFFNKSKQNGNGEKERMDERKQKLLKKLKRQNIISDIIWFLLCALFAFLLFLNRN